MLLLACQKIPDDQESIGNDGKFGGKGGTFHTQHASSSFTTRMN